MSENTQAVPEEIFLTFAELEALAAELPTWPAVREATGTQPPADGQVAAAGWATLMLRDLARQSPGDDKTQVAGPVIRAAQSVGGATTILSLVHHRADGTVMPLFYCAGDTRALLRINGPGLYAITALVNDITIPDQMALLVATLLDQEDGDIAIGATQGRLTVQKHGDEWGLSTDTAAPHPATKESVLAAVHSLATS